MRILKEPLLHFFLIGAVFFGAYRFLNRAEITDAEISVSTEQIEELAAIFSKDWNQEPTEEELNNLVDDFIREELAVREGMEQGLDVDDAVIRQRLRQKLEIRAEEGTSKYFPTDIELQRYFEKNGDMFRGPECFSFYQVFLTRDHQDQAGALLEELRTTERPISTFGDPAPGGPHTSGVTAEEIDRAFGLGFSDQLIELNLKRWSLPIESELGLHLVYVERREPGAIPDLESIRYRVEFEWENEQRLQRLEQLYSNLWKKYDVQIDGRSD